MVAEILRRTGDGVPRFFVEFGAADGREAVCVALAGGQGWPGLFMEADAGLAAGLAATYADRPDVRTRQALVTPDTIDALLRDAGVPARIGVLAIDVDGADYWIWEAISVTRAAVVVIEYNAHLDPARRLVQPLDAALEPWDATDYFGASLGALRALGERLGYALVHTDSTGSNAFFVRADLPGTFPAPGAVPIHGPNYLGAGLRHAPDPLRRPYLDLDA